MDVFLAGTDSLKLTRIARQDPNLALVPAGDAHRHADQSPLDIAALRLALPEGLSTFRPAEPLSLTFFSRESRSSAACILSRALLTRLPSNSFLEVIQANGDPWPYAGSGELHLFVESPGLSLVRMEQQVQRLVKHGALTPNAAFIKLLTFPMEACGLYARNASDPAHGPCTFELEPIQSPEKIVELLDDLEGIRGLRRARRAASLVQSGAGSPEETLLSLAFKLPEHLGGIEAPAFLENEPIDWPQEVRHLIEHKQMRPDFHWPGHLTAGEYNGKDHISEAAFEEDQRRIRDYQRCGISVFPASYKNVRTIHALNGYLASVAHSLAKTEGPEFEARVRRALEDEGATHARRVLLSQTLPAIPSEKPCW